MLTGPDTWREYRSICAGTVQRYAGVLARLLLTVSRHHRLALLGCLEVEPELLPDLGPRLQEALTELHDALHLWRQTAEPVVQLDAPFDPCDTLHRLHKDAATRFKSDPAWARPLHCHISAVLKAIFHVEGEVDGGSYQFATQR
jgi:hypothetical protein